MTEDLFPADRDRLVSLFDRAAQLSPGERADFVDQQCGANAPLRSELERLLSGLSGEDAVERLAGAGPLAPGTRIGPYELLERIGQGGMGDVYAADQTAPVVRRVALKLIRRGMDSAQVVARFEAERQALARMSHPNIAQVFDGGATEEGGPYFVMEYVDGESITEHCDRYTLSTRERVELFTRVCEGVQHAHQKGLIHRDLKPSNLLVTRRDGEAVPKIIDFGVARATTGRLVDRTLHTVVGQIVGTLDYMSPEQADPTGVDVDTRSDIYSLGVVLYQLVSGLLPFDFSSAEDLRFSEVQRSIQDEEAPTPSMRLRRESGTATAIAPLHGTDERALVRQLSGDLDWICLKALEKEPGRRYASASELAQDLRRYLDHEPVLAGRPGALYRARKFVRRHRVGVAAGGAVTAAALIGLWGVVSARFEAEARADEVFHLSALQTLEDLTGEADALWPADAARVDGYESWLARAAELAAELPDHEARLLELRKGARRGGPDGTEWVFGDRDGQWWHTQLAKLVEGLRAFEDPESGLFSSGISSEHGWGVRRRLDFARSLRARTVTDPQVAADWVAAATRVAENPLYGGLELATQVGLVPLGADPVSTLEEFAHPLTGDVPTRSGAGELVLSEGMGLVFVLIPGGRFEMGSQGDDPAGTNYDPMAEDFVGPVHPVELSPFFLSKFELTQGQLERFAGINPSRNQPDELRGLHPVEGSNSGAADELCARLGLSLPSEAQWEYAGRAGTGSIWWTGDGVESLAEMANLRGIPGGRNQHAPVGSYPPNAFGLHDVMGNVWEWCRDGFEDDFYRRSPLVDPLCEPVEGGNRVLRGGGYGTFAGSGRLALRRNVAPDHNGGAAGLRPGRPLAR